VAVAFAKFLGVLMPLQRHGRALVAVAVVVVLTAINCLGVREGKLVAKSLHHRQDAPPF